MTTVAKVAVLETKVVDRATAVEVIAVPVKVAAMMGAIQHTEVDENIVLMADITDGAAKQQGLQLW